MVQRGLLEHTGSVCLLGNHSTVGWSAGGHHSRHSQLPKNDPAAAGADQADDPQVGTTVERVAHGGVAGVYTITLQSTLQSRMPKILQSSQNPQSPQNPTLKP